MKVLKYLLIRIFHSCWWAVWELILDFERDKFYRKLNVLYYLYLLIGVFDDDISFQISLTFLLGRSEFFKFELQCDL